MAKQINKYNWRVEVFPKPTVYGFRINEGREDKVCKEIAEQIKRHCDEIDQVCVEYDKEPVCEHCGYSWTEDGDAYNGGCCAKDEDGKPEVEPLPSSNGRY